MNDEAFKSLTIVLLLSILFQVSTGIAQWLSGAALLWLGLNAAIAGVWALITAPEPEDWLKCVTPRKEGSN